MNRTHIVPVAGALALVLFTALPRPARAQSFDGCCTPPADLTLAVLAGIVGLGTDVGITASLGASGHVGLGWSVIGAVSWGFVSIENLNLAAGSGMQHLLEPDRLAFTVFAAGSFVYSLWATSKAPPKVAVTPTAVVGPKGKMAPGLALVGRF